MFELLDRVVGLRIKNGLFGVALTLLVVGGAPLKADAWGIEIPANFGKWFLAIKDWYVQNQALIAQGRRLYVQYNRIRSTYDLLQGISAPEFRDRWVSNIETLAVANAAFYVQEELINGDFRGFFEQLLGLGEKDVVIPSEMKLFALEVVRNKSILGALVPRDFALEGLLPKEAWLAINEEVSALGTYHIGYQKLREARLNDFYQAFIEVHFETIITHPLSPMASLPREEIFGLLFHGEHPFHAAKPYEGEAAFDAGGRLINYEAYLSRRVLSEIWLSLGQMLRSKLMDVEAWLQEKSLRIRAAARETTLLVDQINDLYFGFRSLAGSGGNAGGFATALSLAAGGSSDEVAEGESRVGGFIKGKLDGVVQRAESVAQNIDFAIGEIRTIRQKIPRESYAAGRTRIPRLGTTNGKPLGWTQNNNQILRRYLDTEAL